MKYKCKHCKASFENYSQLGGHMTKHTFNNEKRKEKSKRMTLKRISVLKVCPKCKREFEVFRLLHKDGQIKPNKDEKKFCSRKCANGHIQTEEQNKARSNKLKKDKPIKSIVIKSKKEKVLKPKPDNNKLFDRKYCLFCNKELSNKNKCGYCKSHSYMSEERNKLISENVKNQYKNGKQVFGGKTKWIQYKNIKIQGTYEYRTCNILDYWKSINKIADWKYSDTRIKYLGEDNKYHTYIIDFHIINLDLSSEYIEVKGWIKSNDLLKIESAKQQGLKIQIWFNEDIIKHEGEIPDSNRH